MDRYPEEPLDGDDDDGTMVDNVKFLAENIVGHRILRAEKGTVKNGDYGELYGFVLTLDTGLRVVMQDTNDCCAHTSLNAFIKHPEMCDHIITGVGTTDGYQTWHIYADMGDVLKLEVGWSPGNPFYYMYGFSFTVCHVLD